MNNYTTLLLVSSIILLITNEAYPEELPPKTEPSISQFERIFPAKISPSYSVVNYPGMKDYKVPIYRLHDTVTDANLSKQYIYQSPYGLDLTRSKTTSRALASLTAQKSLILLEVPSRIVDNTFITNIKLLPNVRMLVIRNELNVTAANYQQLVNLNNLASISITSRTLTDQHITMLAKNPTLQEIFINSQFLTDRAINILSQMPNLTGIGSNSPKITDSGIAKLAQLPNLETIYFPEKSIGKLSVQAFDQADKTHLLPWFRNNEGTKPKSREDITAINFERDTNPDFLNHIRALPNVKRFHFPPGYINDKLIDILSMNKLLHVMFDIKTNNGQKIIDVNTSNLRLPTRIFTAFFDFDDVEVINMPIFSSIDSKDFVHLTKLTKLKEVSFQGSNISGIALREIIKHPTLSVLRLVDCKLNKEEAVALAGAKNLQTLHISDTNLAYFDAALLSRTSITELTLTNCVGSPQFFLALSQAKQIKKLSIRFNLALLGNIKFLSSLKHLEELTIVGREPNEVVDPELFRSLSQLENLANLNITNIIGKDDQYSLFRTMTGLKKISIDNPSSSVTDKLFTTLSHCSKLQSITLTKMSSINGTMLSDLSVLPELTHMHFTNIGFSSGEVLRLTQLPKLNTVSFSGNTESNVGQYIHLINKLNPNLNIQFNELFIPR